MRIFPADGQSVLEIFIRKEPLRVRITLSVRTRIAHELFLQLAQFPHQHFAERVRHRRAPFPKICPRRNPR